ncbi:unnamed protein product [Allacma fusca]|uniref:Uncharacterized protein n=1 Tax=Allacma fusca TaxID=39272 RepID=A0A8J2LET4_9HEXA|nr:unnamed protein product [Allacma fusca]
MASTSLSYFARRDVLGFQHSVKVILGCSGNDDFNVSIAGVAGFSLWLLLCILRKIVLRRVLLYHGGFDLELECILG